MKMIKRSLKNGETIKMTDRTYRGAVPVYAEKPRKDGMPVEYFKVTKGIPFVRARAA